MQDIMRRKVSDSNAINHHKRAQGLKLKKSQTSTIANEGKHFLDVKNIYENADE